MGKRPATFKPSFEILEDRSLPSTVAYAVPAGTVGQQAFGGPLGMDFNVAQSIAITELGVFDSGSDGLAVPLTARLYNRDTQTQVASLSFGAGQTGTLIGGSRFLPLATPVLLPAGFHGTIVAEGYGVGEENGNAVAQPITWATNSDGGLISFVGTGRWGTTPGAFPTNPDSGPANRYAAGTFEFMPYQQIVTGAASGTAGQPYTLNLGLGQASNITSWTINWGDGHTDVLPGNPAQATHVYTAGGTFSIAVTANDSSLGALGTSYRDVVLADGATAYWRLDETGTPAVAHDQVGGHDAVYHNFTAADLGQPGALPNDTSTSVQFNGVNQYLSLPDVFNYPTSGMTTQYAVSFGAWFKTTSGGVILGQSDTTAMPGGAAPQGFVPGLYVGTDGKVYASLFWHGPRPTLSSSGGYNDGRWHQVVDVYNNGVETLYLDGNAVGSQAAWTIGYAPAYSYTLGTGYTAGWPSTTGGWSFFNGQLAEAAVNSGAWSAQQVAAQYLAGTTARQTVVVEEDVTPVASLQGPANGVRGQARTFTFSATSPSPSEQAGGFTYTIDWGDGSAEQIVQRTPGNDTGVSVSHVFTESGSYSVTVFAADQDGHGSAPANQSIDITPWAVETQADPLHPNKTMQVLVVGGSSGADSIFISRGPHGRGIAVDITEKTLHQHLHHVFSGRIDRIVVYGQDGNDYIQVSQNIKLTSELFAGNGNNVLIGGGGDNILVGGAGNNVLIGGRGRNLMIGGRGKDTLVGYGHDDILIGGWTDYDANEIALRAVMAEWESRADYKTRVGHILGTLAGGHNGKYHLNATTVHDSGNADVLIGGNGRDWFFAGTEDKIKHRRRNEIVTPITVPPAGGGGSGGGTSAGSGSGGAPGSTGGVS
jgi:hypothetical protein